MKTNLDSLFKTDKAMETEGIIFELREGIRFKLRRFGGFNAEKVKPIHAVHYKPFARQIELGTLSADKEREIFMTIFIKVCLVDWEGIEFDGKAAECNLENALKLFKALPDLVDTLSSYAQDSKNYREDLGNS